MPTNVTAKRLANPKAVHYLKNKALLPAFSYADVLAYEHAIAFSVAKMMNADLLADTQNALTQALDNGTPFSEFKKQIKPYLMAKGWWGEQVMTDPKDGQRKTVQLGSDRRLKTIYETNLSAAYAQGRWQAIQANKHLLPYLQYMPSVSKKKRDEHKGYYGLIRPVDDPIWQIIYPPNGFGCKCWVKSLTQKEAQALLAKQDTPHHLPKISEHNPRRGVNVETIAGTEGSFASNGDRLSALLKVAEQKHGDAFSQKIKEQLGEFMLDLVVSPNFNRLVPTVVGDEFKKRVGELKSTIFSITGGKEIKDEKQIRQLEKDHATVGSNYAVAVINQNIKEFLETTTNIVWLSEQTVVKTLARHPEQVSVELFNRISGVIKNAILIVEEKKDCHISFFKAGENTYQATIKSTQDRSELYVVTIFKTNTDEIKRAKKNKKILFNKTD